MNCLRIRTRVLVPFAALVAVCATAPVGPAAAAGDVGTSAEVRLPGVATNVIATAGDGMASVSWAAADGNGARIGRYLVRSEPDGVEIGVAGDQTSTSVYGLRNGTTYTFSVRTDQTECLRHNACPTSAPSNPVTPVWADAPVARTIDAACPLEVVPPSPFTDVPLGSAHDRATACLVWWGVTSGRTATTFAPGDGVSRDAMAAFVARTMLAVAPGSLPEAPADAFTDDEHSLHEKAIDQLAAVGIVGGTGAGTYTPGAPVTRGQMARFLAKAADHLLEQPLQPSENPFHDAASSPFSSDIAWIVSVGLTTGWSDGTYRPGEPVSRGQMASFLARTLALLVESGAELPA